MDKELKVYNRWGIEIVSGSGCIVVDSQGQRYLDLYAGHAVTSTGHCHPKVVRAIKDQCEQMIFYSNMVDFEVRRALADKLVAAVPGAASVFFVNAGTEANEAALATARGLTGRRKVIAFEGGFHGRTLGTLSLCGIDGYRAKTVVDGSPLAGDVDILPFGDVEALSTALGDDVAAVITEPVQGLAGARVPPSGFLRALPSLCRDAGAFFILDEVQTGVGRTGAFTAASRYGVVPDMITLAKGLGSGFPISSLLVSEAIASQVGPGDLGTTFGGGPLACSAAMATLEVIFDEDLPANAAACEDYARKILLPLPGVIDVRGAGLLLGILLDREASPVIKTLREQGILVGGATDKNVLRLTPPLVVGRPELDRFADTLASILETGRA